jgi:DNA-binding IclR family transcriptional regulator
MLSVTSDDIRNDIIRNIEFLRFTPNTITDPVVFKEHLKKVAIQGFAFDDEEHEEGIRCAAAPVRDHSGAATAAISVSAPITRMSRKRMQEMGILVRDTCVRLSTSLGFREK